MFSLEESKDALSSECYIHIYEHTFSKLNCAFKNIEGRRVDGKMNNEEKQASTKFEYGNI